LPREKARTPARKKRPASKGPKKRVGGNHGNGKKFESGTNSHDGEVFRRGPDQIPRGSATLMFRVIAADRRQQIYDSLSKLVEQPRGALEFMREFADRTEGKPTQRHELAPPRETYFAPAPAQEEAPPAPERTSAPSASIAPTVSREPVLIGPNGERFRAL